MAASHATSQQLPPPLAEHFNHCAYSAERCAAAYVELNGFAEVTRRANECATLCRSAAKLLAGEAPLAYETARLAVASAVMCQEECAMHTEHYCNLCVDACRSCIEAYRAAAYGSLSSVRQSN